MVEIFQMVNRFAQTVLTLYHPDYRKRARGITWFPDNFFAATGAGNAALSRQPGTSAKRPRNDGGHEMSFSRYGPPPSLDGWSDDGVGDQSAQDSRPQKKARRQNDYSSADFTAGGAGDGDYQVLTFRDLFESS